MMADNLTKAAAETSAQATREAVRSAPAFFCYERNFANVWCPVIHWGKPLPMPKETAADRSKPIELPTEDEGKSIGDLIRKYPPPPI